jgi:hypothetical protein
MGKFLPSAALALVVLVAPASAQQPTPVLQEFEFLGCSGGWDGELQKPEVWRVVADGKVSFLTHSTDSCGLSGGAPVVSGGPELLNLQYDLQAKSDGVAMCECEYWAKFSFGSDARSVKSVTFNGQQAVLRGEWPGE